MDRIQVGGHDHQRIASNAVFGYQTSASGQAYVGLRLIFPGESGGESVTVADGAEMRNE